MQFDENDEEDGDSEQHIQNRRFVGENEADQADQ